MAGTGTSLLAAARAGDERAFGLLVEPHHGELHAHCYRMLGSVHDAEDALQDTLLRAWRGLARFEGRSSLRSWLYAIATNASLKLLARRARRALPMDVGPASDAEAALAAASAEGTWIEPYPDARLADPAGEPEARYEQREALELAFVAAVQQLAPRPRAVLLLREVLGFSAAEVATALDTTVPAVNSALQRARATLAARLPQRSQQQTLRALGDDAVRAVVARYMDAWERGDVAAVAAMLAEDAILAMPPTPTWFQGLEAITAFHRGLGALRWRHVPTTANGQPAVGCYAWDAEAEAFRATVVDVLALRPDGRIAEIVAFVTPDAFATLGLPAAPPG